MYYGLISLSVLMFGGCFALNDVYREKRGSSLAVSLEFTCISSIAGLAVLFAINGFLFEFTWFTFALALAYALVGIGFTFCGFRALDRINLSLYSLFSMLGGMVLPFVQGIVFYGEELTFGKAACFLVICIALLLTVKPGEKKNGTLYYIGIFVLNGMSGVISKFFTEAPFAKTSAAGFSILTAACSVVLSIFLLVWMRKKPKAAGLGVSALGGALNRVANFLLVIALMHVDASVQYPMVTGGVMIVSTLLCYFGKTKPTRRELLSVAVAFVGLFLLLIPS